MAGRRFRFHTLSVSVDVENSTFTYRGQTDGVGGTLTVGNPTFNQAKADKRKVEVAEKWLQEFQHPSEVASQVRQMMLLSAEGGSRRKEVAEISASSQADAAQLCRWTVQAASPLRVSLKACADASHYI